MSLADLFGNDDGFLAGSPLSLLHFRDFGLVNWLILRRDWIEYAWATWVLGYDRRQAAFLEQLLGKVDALRIGLLFAVAAGVTLLPFALLRLLARRRERPDPRDALIQRFCDKMARAGLPRHRGEGILDYAQRIASENPQLGIEASAIAETYVCLRYDPAHPDGSDELRSRIRKLKPSRAR